MAIYAIGDVQGCFDELQALLNLINFNPLNDQLWFTGDLVNRGEKSLETLRFVKQLGTSAVTVLGNHDIHLLVSANFPERIKKKDTLQCIITAPDCDELLDWLRKQPLFHYEHDIGMMHAGIPPQWDLTKTQKLATRCFFFFSKTFALRYSFNFSGKCIFCNNCLSVPRRG